MNPQSAPDDPDLRHAAQLVEKRLSEVPLLLAPAKDDPSDDDGPGIPRSRRSLYVTQATVRTANFLPKPGAAPGATTLISLDGKSETVPPIRKGFLRFTTEAKVPAPHWNDRDGILTIYLPLAFLPSALAQIDKTHRVMVMEIFPDGHVWAEFYGHD